MGKGQQYQFLLRDRQSFTPSEDASKAKPPAILLPYKFQDRVFQEPVVTFRFWSGSHIREPAFADSLSGEPFQPVGGKIVHHLVESELRLVNFHHLDGKIRVHGLRLYFGDELLDLLIKPLHGAARGEHPDLLRTQGEAQRVQVFIHSQSLQKSLISDPVRIPLRAGDHMQCA